MDATSVIGAHPTLGTVTRPGSTSQRITGAVAEWLPALVVACWAVFWFAGRALRGIRHIPAFGDESGHMVGARAIAAGDRLYRDFIDAHGPLTFAIAHLHGKLFGWAEPLDARWDTVVFIVIGGVAVASTPALSGFLVRCWATALYFGLLAAPWLVQALNMLSYHPLGGALVTVALAWLVVPAWVGTPPARWQAAAAGGSLGLLCADAYSLAPTAFLLGGSAALALRSRGGGPETRRVLAAAAVGFGAGCLVMLLWMLRYGDLVGYLVFHVISLQVNYARYTQPGFGVMVGSLLPSFDRAALVQATASVAGAGAFVSFLSCGTWPRAWRGWMRVAALGSWIFAILMLNYRGMVFFQDGALVVATMAMLALALPTTVTRFAPVIRPGLALGGTLAVVAILMGAEAVDRRARNSPFGLTRHELLGMPASRLAANDASIFRRVRDILRPDERPLVLVYDPTFFLLAGVLPMRRFHEFLPWEADYARSPWFGRERDLCATLARDPPPVIVYDAWKVWGMYDPAVFIPCLPGILAAGYVADPIPTLFVRKDRANH